MSIPLPIPGGAGLVFAPDSHRARLINRSTDGGRMNDSLQLLHAIRFSIGFLGLALAAFMDLRTRRVPNQVWWVMGVAAGILWLVDMHLRERPWEHFALLGPLVIFFAYAFIDPTDWPWQGKRVVWHGLEAASLIGLVYLAYRRLLPIEDMDWDFAGLLAVPLMMGLMVGAYYAGVMVGGADVKALMTVALLAPTASELVPWDLWVASDTLQVSMPFVIFGNSLLCYLIIPVLFLVWNAAHGHTGPPWAQMFFGYKLPIAKARQRFVWPMERYVAPVSEIEKEEEEEEKKENEMGQDGTAGAEDTNGADDRKVEYQAGKAPMDDEPLGHVEEPDPDDDDVTSHDHGDAVASLDNSAEGTSSSAEGRVLFELFPRNRHDTQEVLDGLEAAGRTQVWVTPKTPFMVPLAVAWVVSHLVGDVFFSLFIW